METAGDIKSVFAHKVFCAWDFSTATSEAAALKSKNIHNELKVRMQPVLFSSASPLSPAPLFSYFSPYTSPYTSSSASASVQIYHRTV
jgi:hypothetical protein